MKKLLIVFVCAFFTITAFAADSVKLTGVISDSQDSAKKIKGVKINLGGKSKPSSGRDGEYTIPKFSNIADSSNLIFTHDDYYPMVIKISRDSGKIVGTSKSTVTGDEKEEFSFADSATEFKYDFEMKHLPVPIISGTVTDENDRPLKDIEVTAFGVSNFMKKTQTNEKGFYEIEGDLGTAGDPKKYALIFNSNNYEEKKLLDIKVEDKLLENQNIKLTEINTTKELQNNIEEMTGFGCSETMPKYLVGASCEENSELKGDATDIAMWIQNFGGKITSLVGMIAVVLIVWNSFTLVTAAGDSDKISQGKKGIMWTLLGLAVIMFAYVIVKTVVVLMYTQ